jgi:hypothetical protein
MECVVRILDHSKFSIPQVQSRGAGVLLRPWTTWCLDVEHVATETITLAGLAWCPSRMTSLRSVAGQMMVAANAPSKREHRRSAGRDDPGGGEALLRRRTECAMARSGLESDTSQGTSLAVRLVRRTLCLARAPEAVHGHPGHRFPAYKRIVSTIREQSFP